MKPIEFEPILLRDLKDDEFALEFLKAAMEGEDLRPFLLALTQVCEARGIAKSKLARDAGLNRAGLHRLLTQGTNPKIDTLMRVLDKLGFGLSLKLKQQAS